MPSASSALLSTTPTNATSDINLPSGLQRDAIPNPSYYIVVANPSSLSLSDRPGLSTTVIVSKPSEQILSSYTLSKRPIPLVFPLWQPCSFPATILMKNFLDFAMKSLIPLGFRQIITLVTFKSHWYHLFHLGPCLIPQMKLLFVNQHHPSISGGPRTWLASPGQNFVVQTQDHVIPYFHLPRNWISCINSFQCSYLVCTITYFCHTHLASINLEHLNCLISSYS